MRQKEREADSPPLCSADGPSPIVFSTDFNALQLTADSSESNRQERKTKHKNSPSATTLTQPPNSPGSEWAPMVLIRSQLGHADGWRSWGRTRPAPQPKSITLFGQEAASAKVSGILGTKKPRSRAAPSSRDRGEAWWKFKCTSFQRADKANSYRLTFQKHLISGIMQIGESNSMSTANEAWRCSLLFSTALY